MQIAFNPKLRPLFDGLFKSMYARTQRMQYISVDFHNQVYVCVILLSYDACMYVYVILQTCSGVYVRMYVCTHRTCENMLLLLLSAKP